MAGSKAAPTAYSSGMRGNSEKPKMELESIRVERVQNGWKVSTNMRPVRTPGKSSDCCGLYEPAKEMVFTSADEAHGHIGKQMGIAAKPATPAKK